jgi:hypothetical protein
MNVINPVINFISRYVSMLNGMTPDYQFTIEDGHKYAKIVQSYRGTGRSVHAFVDKRNGDVFKAASWKAPMRDARYNVMLDQDVLAKNADPYGSYLYKGYARKP